MLRRDVLTGVHYLSGDVASAEGAIAAGCRFFAGYPITPSSELAERMARRLPEAGGVYLQMEDELGSVAAILGASWGGIKAMTATSGPGFSLMMENYGLGIMMECPAVIVNVQRAGPSTGLPTLVGQGDVMQTKWGTHGPYEAIALSPSSPQECFDLTIKAFNLSEQFRQPVVVLMDECVGHMFEKVVIPRKDDIFLVSRPRPVKAHQLPFEADDDLIPPMPIAGEGHNIHITGLTHDERGYPVMTGEAQERLLRRIINKIKKHEDKIIEVEEYLLEDAEVCVVAYGISARSAKRAVLLAREKGIKAGLLRLITIWPFPEKKVKRLAEHLERFVVVEINQGQILKEVERCACGRGVYFTGKMGGDIHSPQEILRAIRRNA